MTNPELGSPPAQLQSLSGGVEPASTTPTTRRPQTLPRRELEWWEGHGDMLPVITYLRYGGKALKPKQDPHFGLDYIADQAKLQYRNGGIKLLLAGSAGVGDQMLWDEHTSSAVGVIGMALGLVALAVKSFRQGNRLVEGVKELHKRQDQLQAMDKNS